MLLDSRYAALSSSLTPNIAFLISFQNYFRDPWNAFDFFIVAGSFVDLGLAKINVSILPIFLYLFIKFQSLVKIIFSHQDNFLNNFSLTAMHPSVS